MRASFISALACSNILTGLCNESTCSSDDDDRCEFLQRGVGVLNEHKKGRREDKEHQKRMRHRRVAEGAKNERRKHTEHQKKHHEEHHKELKEHGKGKKTVGAVYPNCSKMQPSDNKPLFAAISMLGESEMCVTPPPINAPVRLGWNIVGRQMGLINQVRMLADALALACLESTSLVIDIVADVLDVNDAQQLGRMLPGFKGDGIRGDAVQRSEGNRWSMILELDQLQQKLAADVRCNKTQIVPRGCLVGSDVMTICSSLDHVNMFWEEEHPGTTRANLYKALLLQMPLRRDFDWTPSPIIDMNSPYNAVHLNLDSDWMLFRTDPDLYHVWRNSNNDTWRAIVANECCSSRRTKQGQWAVQALHKVINAVLQVMKLSLAPLVVVSAIGKPGHTNTLWVLDEFRSKLPKNHTIVTGSMSSSQREIMAAGELQLLCRAEHAILHAGSSFSGFAINWRPANGIKRPDIAVHY